VSRSSPRDYLGYYDTLGVKPGATAQEIKAAYRSRAMELHPDRNPGHDTTADFQVLQQAYDVLSGSRSRAEYDAESEIEESLEEAAGQGAPLHHSPIYCSRCNAVSAQPRYRVFYTVYSWFWGSKKQPTQGVFCGECEFRVGARAQAITLVAGWWNVVGFFWTLGAIWDNFEGGQYDKQTAQLMGYQAIYFANTGNMRLALAIGNQALEMIERVIKKNPQGARTPAAGRGSLSELSQALNEMIAACRDRVIRDSSSELEPVGMWGTRRVIVQATMVAAVVGLPFLASIDDQGGNRGAPDSSVQGAPALIASPTFAPAPQESAPEAELPPSGILHSGASRPVSLESNPALRLVNPPGSHKLIKLTPVDERWASVLAFVRSGDSVEIALRPGRYRMSAAAGWNWYGYTVRFGADTEYFAFARELEFRVEGKRLLGHEVDLVRVKDGNLIRAELRPEQF